MGVDLFAVAQRKNDQGEWEELPGWTLNFCHGTPYPFEDRDPQLFTFLGYKSSPEDKRENGVIALRGIPEDFTPTSDYGKLILDNFMQRDTSWVTVEELVAFDYSIVTDQGDTLKEAIDQEYFSDLEELQRIGAERVVFCF